MITALLKNTSASFIHIIYCIWTCSAHFLSGSIRVCYLHQCVDFFHIITQTRWRVCWVSRRSCELNEEMHERLTGRWYIGLCSRDRESHPLNCSDACLWRDTCKVWVSTFAAPQIVGQCNQQMGLRLFNKTNEIFIVIFGMTVMH